MRIRVFESTSATRSMLLSVSVMLPLSESSLINGIKGNKGYKQAYKFLYVLVFLAKIRWSFCSKFNFLSP